MSGEAVSALLAAFGLKDLVYGALIAAALAWGGWTYHKYEAAVTYAADARAETASVLKAAQQTIQDDQTDYASKLKTIEASYASSLTVANAQSADLVSRLRLYQAARCPSAVLQGAPAAPASAAAGPSSVINAVAGLISAAIKDNATCVAERAERDALTGK